MPEVSRFFGIISKMYFDDHPPPHFHAEYGENEALININTLSVIAGKLRPRVLVPDKLNPALFWQDIFHWTQSVRYAFRRRPAEREIWGFILNS